jgi:asparagine synthetase B (glutamine-hydrolysing)
VPGIFGGIGCDGALYSALEREFSAIWGACDVCSAPGAWLGGHAFRPAVAVHDRADGCRFAVDGEHALYRLAVPNTALEPLDLFRVLPSGQIETNFTCTGNLAVLEPEARTLHLAVDWTGTFPLYYCRLETGLLFASHLRPLARAIGARKNVIGILEFLRHGYTVAGKTAFREIHRLMPGQALRFDAAGRLQIEERSRAWAGVDAHPVSLDDTWAALVHAANVTLSNGHGPAVMMSAGWDSRTLLAMGRDAGRVQDLHAYSHGDVKSRELAIVRRLCRAANIGCRLESIDASVLELEALQQGFARVENVVFPHWHRAGRLLAHSGTRCVTAGVLGEVLGGHYGPAMLLRDRKKIAAVASALSGRGGRGLDSAAPDRRAARALLRIARLGRHWYLDREFEDTLPDRMGALNGEIETALNRLESRGIGTGNQLVEAFIAEHRGAQYINAQLTSCRAHLDVALPFGERGVFQLASRIPLSDKIQNRLNRALLQRFAPQLLRYPLAATLLPASMPVALQEASRLLRSIRESAQWRLHFRTNGRTRPPRLGWVNFEFLRSGHALHQLVNDLQGDLWDRVALRRRIGEIEQGRWHHQLHPMFDQLAKIYTIDLLLR